MHMRLQSHRYGSKHKMSSASLASDQDERRSHACRSCGEVSEDCARLADGFLAIPGSPYQSSSRYLCPRCRTYSRGLLRKFREITDDANVNLLVDAFDGEDYKLEIPRKVFVRDHVRHILDSVETDREMHHVAQNYLPFVAGILFENLFEDNGTKKSIADMSTQFSKTVAGVIMIADVNGYTSLVNNLKDFYGVDEGVEVIATSLNSYFAKLIDYIYDYGGDVIKFAGDAVIALWTGPHTSNPYIYEQAALVCAWNAKDTVHYVPYGEKKCTLTLHCGISSGQVSIVSVGGVENKYELLLIGETIKNAGIAEAFATAKEVVICNDTWKAVKTICSCTEVGVEDGSPTTPQVGSSSEQLVKQDSFSGDGYMLVDKVTTNTQVWVDRSVDIEMEISRADLAKMMSVVECYIPGLVVNCIDERYTVENEVRMVSSMFVKLGNLGFQTWVGESSFLQDIFYSCQQVVLKHNGMIRQFIVDDKGCILIVCFGVSSFRHRDDADRIIQTAFGLRSTLDTFDVTNGSTSIGIATGQAFCGLIGRAREHGSLTSGYEYQRREFAIVGDCVNIAARLMSGFPNRIVCDEETTKECHLFKFTKHDEPYRPKGKDYFMDVHEPIYNEEMMHNQQNSYNSDRNLFCIGRESQEKVIMDQLNAFHSKVIHNPFLLIESDAGLGKSVLLDWFKGQVAEKYPDVEMLTGGCIRYDEKVNYAGLRGMLRGIFGLSKEQNDPHQLEAFLAALKSKTTNYAIPVESEIPPTATAAHRTQRRGTATDEERVLMSSSTSSTAEKVSDSQIVDSLLDDRLSQQSGMAGSGDSNPATMFKENSLAASQATVDARRNVSAQEPMVRLDVNSVRLDVNSANKWDSLPTPGVAAVGQKMETGRPKNVSIPDLHSTQQLSGNVAQLGKPKGSENTDGEGGSSRSLSSTRRHSTFKSSPLHNFATTVQDRFQAGNGGSSSNATTGKTRSRPSLQLPQVRGRQRQITANLGLRDKKNSSRKTSVTSPENAFPPVAFSAPVQQVSLADRQVALFMARHRRICSQVGKAAVRQFIRMDPTFLAKACSKISLLFEANGKRAPRRLFAKSTSSRSTVGGLESTAGSQENTLITELMKLVVLLALSTRGRLVCIVIDDIHWLDPVSWNLLIQIKQFVRGVMIVGTSRSQSKLTSLEEAKLSESPLAIMKPICIDLPPLQAKAIVDLLSYSFDCTDWPADLIDRIMKGSNGNPLWALEIVKGMKSDKVMTINPETKKVTVQDQTSLNEMDVSQGLAGVILHRFDQLSQEKQEIMKRACVISNNFTPEMIGGMFLQHQTGEYKKALTELVSEGFLNMVSDEEPGGPKRFSVSHDYYQTTIYNLITGQQRKRYHLKTAKWLEANNEFAQQLYPLLAHHYNLGGNLNETFRCLYSAAKFHFLNGQDDTGCAYLGKAIELGTLQFDDTHTQLDVNKESLVDMYFLFVQRKIKNGIANEAIEVLRSLEDMLSDKSGSALFTPSSSSSLLTNSTNGSSGGMLSSGSIGLAPSPGATAAEMSKGTQWMMPHASQLNRGSPSTLAGNAGYNNSNNNADQDAPQRVDSSETFKSSEGRQRKNVSLRRISWKNSMQSYVGLRSNRYLLGKSMNMRTFMKNLPALKAKFYIAALLYFQMDHDEFVQEIKDIVKMMLSMGLSSNSLAVQLVLAVAFATSPRYPNQIPPYIKSSFMAIVTSPDTPNTLAVGFMLVVFATCMLNQGQWNLCTSCLTRAQRVYKSSTSQIFCTPNGEIECHQILNCALFQTVSLMEVDQGLQAMVDSVHEHPSPQVEVWCEMWQTLLMVRHFGSIQCQPPQEEVPHDWYRQRWNTMEDPYQAEFVDMSSKLFRVDWVMLCSMRAWRFCKFETSRHVAAQYTQSALTVIQTFRASHSMVYYVIFAYEATLFSLLHLTKIGYRRQQSAIQGSSQYSESTGGRTVFARQQVFDLLERFKSLAVMFPSALPMVLRCEGFIHFLLNKWRNASKLWKAAAKTAKRIGLWYEYYYCLLLDAKYVQNNNDLIATLATRLRSMGTSTNFLEGVEDMMNSLMGIS